MPPKVAPDAGELPSSCLDNDGDGVSGTGTCEGMLVDCDDTDPTVHPGAAEVCNAKDDDCDTETDESLPVRPYFKDSDHDGYGTSASTGTGCRPPTADSAERSGDCNDASKDVNPGATETCNGGDDDCDNQIDEGLPTQNYYPDLDGDSYGSKTAIPQASCRPVAGKVADGTDCNDSNANIHPGANEYCNQIDDDCDNQVDEQVVNLTYYPDLDGDGYGATGSVGQVACAPVAGKVTNATDCNDQNVNIHPGKAEVCDGVDQDCDNQVDEGLPQVNYYTDADNDGYGTANSTPVASCRAVTGRAPNNTDCNDGNAQVNPGAAEICNNLDEDCDNVSDEGNPGGGASCSTGQQGVCSAGTVTCLTGTLTCVRNQGPTTERCDNLDNDCDGSTDETFTDKGQACSAGVGVCQRSGARVCNAAGTGTTCGAVPGGPEPSACDGQDDDCDGLVDEPVLTSTAQVHPNPWNDTEVVPYFYSASGCAGGVNGTGTDALAGGGVAISVQPGVAGIRYLQLDTNGDPVGLTWILSSQYEYLDVDIAQAGDGFLVAGIFTPRAEIDLYYRSYAGAVRATLESQLRPAAGNSIDSFRMVRGNGRRAVLLWRETGPVTSSVGLKLAEVEAYLASGTWTLRDGRTAAATLSSVTLVSGPIEPGLGADSTHPDWAATQPCELATAQRTIAVAYLATAQALRLFTVAENGTGKSAETTVRAETAGRVLGEPEVTYFQSSAQNQWFVAYTTAEPGAGIEDINYWLTTNTAYAVAYSQPASAGGADSVARPRSSATASRIWLSALRDVSDGSGFKRQVMARWIDFSGNKDPTSSSVEVPWSFGACGASQTHCRPGTKAGLSNWAATGRLFYSASGATPSGTFVSAQGCD